MISATVVSKLLRSIAAGSAAQENKHDVIFMAAADQIDMTMKALTLISFGSTDADFPFRAMPREAMQRIAREALRALAQQPEAGA